MRAGNANLDILFVAGSGPIKEEAGGYLHTEALSGAKTLRAVAAVASCAVLFRQGFMA
jgi:hypothetical protein